VASGLLWQAPYLRNLAVILPLVPVCGILPDTQSTLPPASSNPAGVFFALEQIKPWKRSRHPSAIVSRFPTLLETLCRTLQWLEKTEDLDHDDPALQDLKRAILLLIADLEIQDEEEPEAA
jgi:hypothetical protein